MSNITPWDLYAAGALAGHISHPDNCSSYEVNAGAAAKYAHELMKLRPVEEPSGIHWSPAVAAVVVAAHDLCRSVNLLTLHPESLAIFRRAALESALAELDKEAK